MAKVVHSYHLWMRIPLAPQLCQHLLLSVPWILAILILVVSCCFNLLFLNDIWNWISFHMLICQLCIFSGEVYVQDFYLCLNWVCHSPIVGFMFLLFFKIIFSLNSFSLSLKMKHNISFYNYFRKLFSD